MVAADMPNPLATLEGLGGQEGWDLFRRLQAAFWLLFNQIPEADRNGGEGTAASDDSASSTSAPSDMSVNIGSVQELEEDEGDDSENHGEHGQQEVEDSPAAHIEENIPLEDVTSIRVIVTQ